MEPFDVFLGLGANLGDPLRQLRLAVEALRGYVEVTTLSDVYLTEPVGIREQPQFANLVLACTTRLEPRELHGQIERIEAALGRIREVPNGPRLIDIDILAYGDVVLDTAVLTIPHPRMAERAFVLIPLTAIAPDWRHPITGSTVSELLSQLQTPTAVRRIGPLPALER